jgi:hypothetical protein
MAPISIENGLRWPMAMPRLVTDRKACNDAGVENRVQLLVRRVFDPVLQPEVDLFEPTTSY